MAKLPEENPAQPDQPDSEDTPKSTPRSTPRVSATRRTGSQSAVPQDKAAARPTTRLGISRYEREQRTRRIVVIGAAVVGALTILLIAAAVLQRLVIEPNRVVASVNGQNITVSELQKRMRFDQALVENRYTQLAQQVQQIQQQAAQGDQSGSFLLQFYQQQLQQLASQTSADSIAQQALDDMLTDKLVRLEANKRGLTISADDVEKSIEESQGFYRVPLTPFPTDTPEPTAPPTETSAPTNTSTATPQATATTAASNTPAATLTYTPVPATSTSLATAQSTSVSTSVATSLATGTRSASETTSASTPTAASTGTTGTTGTVEPTEAATANGTGTPSVTAAGTSAATDEATSSATSAATSAATEEATSQATATPLATSTSAQTTSTPAVTPAVTTTATTAATTATPAATTSSTTVSETAGNGVTVSGTVALTDTGTLTTALEATPTVVLPTVIPPTSTPRLQPTTITQGDYDVKRDRFVKSYEGIGFNETDLRGLIESNLYADKVREAFASEVVTQTPHYQFDYIRFNVITNAQTALAQLNSGAVTFDALISQTNAITLPAPVGFGTVGSDWVSAKSVEQQYGNAVLAYLESGDLNKPSTIITATDASYLVLPKAREVRPLSASELQTAQQQAYTDWLEAAKADAAVVKREIDPTTIIPQSVQDRATQFAQLTGQTQ